MVLECCHIPIFHFPLPVESSPMLRPASKDKDTSHSSSGRRMELRSLKSGDNGIYDDDDGPTHPPGCPMAMPWYRNSCTRIDELAEFCCCCRDQAEYHSPAPAVRKRFKWTKREKKKKKCNKTIQIVVFSVNPSMSVVFEWRCFWP